MSKRTSALVALLAALFVTIPAYGSESILDGYEVYTQTEIEMQTAQATAYCLNGTTATGAKTRIGICASKPEWFGKVLALYKDADGSPGDFIGYFECVDTGSTPIRNGQVIDVWLPTYNECMQFGRQKVWIAVIDGEG